MLIKTALIIAAILLIALANPVWGFIGVITLLAVASTFFSDDQPWFHQ